ncbi:MAG: hypothetical protein OXC07_08385 [Kistimonas sp.]|nr:hypothetical protein [Kistimonas sp.]
MSPWTPDKPTERDWVVNFKQQVTSKPPETCFPGKILERQIEELHRT